MSKLICRTPNEIDPEIEPSKLFRVERIASYKKQPYWLKRILRDIGLYRVSIYKYRRWILNQLNNK